jgi:hypothetical protein
MLEVEKLFYVGGLELGQGLFSQVLSYPTGRNKPFALQDIYGVYEVIVSLVKLKPLA